MKEVDKKLKVEKIDFMNSIKGDKDQISGEIQTWRKVGIVFILDRNGRILLSQRSPSKKFGPGKWEAGITETLEEGENYKQAAIRGLEQELGLKGEAKDLIQIGSIGNYRFEHENKSRNTLGTFYIYRLPESCKIRTNEEIEKIKWHNNLDELLEKFKRDLERPEEKQSFFSASLEFLNQYPKAKNEVLKLIDREL